MDNTAATPAKQANLDFTSAAQKASEGTLPYPNLETSEQVVYHICMGHKNTNPEDCRPEILHIMRDCWQEPYTLRPSFTDIVCMLESIMENDADYVDVESPEQVVTDEAEIQENNRLRAASVSLDTNF